MSVDFTNKFNVPDFSHLTEAVRKQQEMMRPILEAVQQIRQSIQPIAKFVDEHKTQIFEFVDSFAKVSKVLVAINAMGDAQYVCWDIIDRSLVEALIETENINETLQSAFEENGYESVKNTISQAEAHPLMQKYRSLFSQAVRAYEFGCYDLAVNGFTSILDGLLSDASGNPTHKFDKRIRPILDKLNQQELLDTDECIMFTLAATFQPAIESFFQSAPFDADEPTGLNRHWIAHGRSTREKTQLDAIKMMNLIYGLLLIWDMDAS